MSGGTRARMVRNGSKTYIVLTGYAGTRMRQALQLAFTRVRDTHPRVLELGLGVRGLGNVARGGVLISCFVSAGVETLDFIFNDDATIESLAGGLVTEFGKNIIAGGLAYVAATLTGVAFTSALAPGIVLVAAAFAAGWILNRVDEKYKVKNAVINGFKYVNAEYVRPGWHALEHADMSGVENAFNSLANAMTGRLPGD
ncbi:MAG: hypothetical protein FWD68_18395 [Alphaproteobacteria bacterium]|nr:hypothetical protein [Alphaproteobacteria bacterium]